MRGLRKYLSPFTPDQSGAVSVLFGYGGILVILDAGGCAGNVCGFDEPRWTDEKSAIFSAGLRDMDAILGRDELLISKIEAALESASPKFIGLIGTPVPAVIATDYRALIKLMEDKFKLPVIAVETNGMELYDAGQQKAYEALFDKVHCSNYDKNFSALRSDSEFAEGSGRYVSGVQDNEYIKNKGEYFIKTSEKCVGDIQYDDAGELGKTLGIIGATPLDTISPESYKNFAKITPQYGCRYAVCYGSGDTLEDIAYCENVYKNLVVSPSGLSVAKKMHEKYGVPYETGYPLGDLGIRKFGGKVAEYEPEKVLIIHQQIFANEIRKTIQATDAKPERVDVATWFMLDNSVSMKNDVHLDEEDELLKLVNERTYDMVIGDPLMKRALPGWEGIYLNLPHYAVSGELHGVKNDDEYWEIAGRRC